MFAPITRILLCLALCLVLFSSWGCPSQTCIKYQDVARVGLPLVADIDSTVMIANDSIVGCGSLTRKVVGSKTHRVRFPINVRIQFFSQGELRKELFFEMDKNTIAYVYTGADCSNRLVESLLTEDYCWSIEKIGNSLHNDGIRCTELSVDGETDLCSMVYFN
jgi:hypothetical protein